MAETLTSPVAGLAARAPSVGRMFLDRVAASPDTEAFRYPDGDGWTSLTWAQTSERVHELAAGLLHLGITHQDRVAIACSTRIEWVLVDLAVMCAAGATTTIYPSTTPDDVAYILRDSGSRVAVVEDLGQLAKVQAAWAELPELGYVVMVEGSADDERVLTLAQLAERGRARLQAQPDCVESATAAVGPLDLATLVYTSGTTGRPKGVRLVHDCWTYEAAAVDALGILSADDLQFLWLPLSHVLGKILQVMQLTIGFPTAVDGNLDRIVDNLATVRPTFMGAPPRIFEKVHSRVVSSLQQQGGIKWTLFQWALGVGTKVSRVRQAGGTPGPVLAAQFALADRLVLSTLRGHFGGRVRFFISGSAPLSREIAEFFHAAGILILEGYGLTESSAASFVNRPDRFRFGTVGLPMPGTQVRFGEDGEIMIKGPGVMRGYHNLPEATAQALTDDGWLRTGDIGELQDGFLRITDRKKDLIKTSGGKYVAPQPIEALFAAICPYASHLVVHGDRRNFISALVTLDPDAITGWADKHGLSGSSYQQICAAEATREMVSGYIDELNSRLAHWERIKKFAILDRDLSIEDGELTPSMKVKRRAVERSYAEVLDGFYGD